MPYFNQNKDQKNQNKPKFQEQEKTFEIIQ